MDDNGLTLHAHFTLLIFRRTLFYEVATTEWFAWSLAGKSLLGSFDLGSLLSNEGDGAHNKGCGGIVCRPLNPQS